MFYLDSFIQVSLSLQILNCALYSDLPVVIYTFAVARVLQGCQNQEGREQMPPLWSNFQKIERVFLLILVLTLAFSQVPTALYDIHKNEK